MPVKDQFGITWLKTHQTLGKTGSTNTPLPGPAMLPTTTLGGAAGRCGVAQTLLALRQQLQARGAGLSPSEAPDAKCFDSQKSNYCAADYRANKIPLYHFRK